MLSIKIVILWFVSWLMYCRSGWKTDVFPPTYTWTYEGCRILKVMPIEVNGYGLAYHYDMHGNLGHIEWETPKKKWVLK